MYSTAGVISAQRVWSLGGRDRSVSVTSDDQDQRKGTLVSINSQKDCNSKKVKDPFSTKIAQYTDHRDH
jgi:hypothetical protein